MTLADMVVVKFVSPSHSLTPRYSVYVTGSGQYGDVYEGIWLTHNTTVAVKTLKVR